MNEEQQELFKPIARKYIQTLNEMYAFIEDTGLDNDQVWDKANQLYDEHMLKDRKKWHSDRGPL